MRGSHCFQEPIRAATSSELQALGKLDGIDIDGDLMPMGNSLLIKVKEALSETKNGLFIPDNAKRAH